MMMTLATHEDITRQKASRATLKPKRQMSSHNRLPDVPFGRAVGSFSLVRSTCTSSYPEILWRDLDGKESTSLMPPSLVPSIGFVSSCHRSRNSISRIRSSRFCLYVHGSLHHFNLLRNALMTMQISRRNTRQQ